MGRLRHRRSNASQRMPAGLPGTMIRSRAGPPMRFGHAFWKWPRYSERTSGASILSGFGTVRGCGLCRLTRKRRLQALCLERLARPQTLDARRPVSNNDARPQRFACLAKSRGSPAVRKLRASHMGHPGPGRCGSSGGTHPPDACNRALHADLLAMATAPILVRSDLSKVAVPAVCFFRAAVRFRMSAASNRSSATRLVRSSKAASRPASSASLCINSWVRASASSYSRPHTSQVRIDSTWGGPDSLLYYPHDTFVVDLRDRRSLSKKIDARLTTLISAMLAFGERSAAAARGIGSRRRPGTSYWISPSVRGSSRRRHRRRLR